jgi:hypothetical protein
MLIEPLFYPYDNALKEAAHSGVVGPINTGKFFKDSLERLLNYVNLTEKYINSRITCRNLRQVQKKGGVNDHNVDSEKG